MKDNLTEFSNPRLIESSEPVKPWNSGFYETRQHEQTTLDLILTSLQKYWYVTILTTAIMMAGIVYKTLKEPRIYKSGVQIAIELNKSSSLAEKLSTSNGSSGGLPDERTTTIETITQILKSRAILQKAVDSIADRELRPSIGNVITNLDIKSSQSSNILNLSYTDTSPGRIVAILNSLSKVYIEYSIKTKKARTDNSIAFIESQLPNSRQRLEVLSKQLEQFRRKYGFIDPESSARKLADYRQELVAKMNESRTQYDQTQQQYVELQKQLTTVGLKSNNVLSTTMLTQDTAYQELFKKLNELELAYSQERVRFSDENPLVIIAKEKRDQVLLLLKNRAQQMLKREVTVEELTNGGIANFSNSLAQNLANKQAELQTSLVSQTAQYQNLNKVYERVEMQISQLPTLQKQYTELQRQYTIHSQELTAFLQKLQELKIADAEQVVPWKLIDPAEVPSAPISPNVERQIGFGGVASLLVGVLLAIGCNKLDNRIDNPDTVKSMTGIPILALIPNVDSFEEVVRRGGSFLQHSKNKSKHYAYWSFVEAMRTLALGIGLTREREENQVGKVIAFTSALPKEGKSTITFHTSIALAELGYRVLLVDVDLYKSTLIQLCHNSTLFSSVDLSNNAGLSNILLREYKWQDLIKKSPQMKLEVLFSGNRSVNSIALLNSPHFAHLIKQWQQEYDYVIFDTPPIVGVSDTRLIASLVDGLVYVVSLNIAQRQNIDRAIDIIASVQTPVLGLAINRVEHNPSDYRRYHEYYDSSNNLAGKSALVEKLDREDVDIEL
jgi:polysaccharide biosynthesis transport protein